MTSFKEYSNYRTPSFPVLKRFRWRGVDCSGNIHNDNSLALTENQIRAQIEARQLSVIKISARNVSFLTKFQHRFGEKDLQIITQQLASMLAASIPLNHALRLIRQNQNKAEVISILFILENQVESGVPLSIAMNKASPLFHGVYSNLVSTGELSGKIPEVFDRLVTYQLKKAKLKADITKALSYPIVVLLVTFGVLYLMLTFVIPEFALMFSIFNAPLPVFTEMVLSISEFIETHVAKLLGVLSFLCLTTFVLWYRIIRLQLWFSKHLLSLPIIGDIVEKSSIARFCRTLSISLQAGIPIIEALRNASFSCGNLALQSAFQTVYQEVSTGVPLYIAMQKTGELPYSLIQMVLVGEESGTLDVMLENLANLYEDEIDNKLDNLGKVIEPTLIIFLGLIIGGLVVSMYLPIFNLLSVLG